MVGVGGDLTVRTNDRGSVSRDRTLARWAGAFLGSSVLAGPALIFVGLAASAPRRAFANYPGPLLMLLVAVAALVVSAIALTRLGRGAPRVLRRLWRISLFCNVVIVGVIIFGFGFKAGVVLSIMELIAISIHRASTLRSDAKPRSISRRSIAPYPNTSPGRGDCIK